jgi:hypothetical protein
MSASFETPACGGLLRMRSQILMVRSASSRVSNHETTGEPAVILYHGDGRGLMMSRRRHFYDC